MENYDGINKIDSVLSRYDNYKINYERKRPRNFLWILLIQLFIAAALILIILILKFVPAFQPVFNSIRNFLQKDIVESLNIFR